MADASAFSRAFPHDEVLEAVGSTRMSDEDFVPVVVNGNFKRAASFRQSIRGRRLPGAGGSASPANVRRTPSMRTTTGSTGTNTNSSLSPTAANNNNNNNLDDVISDAGNDIGEDAVAEEFFSQLSQMKDSIAAMTQSQAEKELQAKAGEQRLMQENGRLQERCASLELQYGDLDRHYQQLMQKELEHYKQMQARAEQDRDFQQVKWDEERQQLKDSMIAAQRHNIEMKKQLDADKADLERLRAEKPWLEEKTQRDAVQIRESTKELDRVRKDLNESKQEQEQLDLSYQEEIKALQSQIAELSYSSASGDHEREHLITELKTDVDRLRQENGELREQNTELRLASSNAAAAAITTNNAKRSSGLASDSLASQLAEAAVQGGYAGKLLGYSSAATTGGGFGSSESRGSRSNSDIDSDISLMKQQRDELRNKTTTCEVCKKKDEEFFRVQSYLAMLVQRVIDTHPEILEIRQSCGISLPISVSSKLNDNNNKILPNHHHYYHNSNNNDVSASATKNPFEEDSTTNPFENDDDEEVEQEEVISTTTTTIDNNSRGRATGMRRDSERMQIDEEEVAVVVAPPPRSVRAQTPVGATTPSPMMLQQQQPPVAQKRSALPKPRAPKAPTAAAARYAAAAAAQVPPPPHHSRKVAGNNIKPVSDC